MECINVKKKATDDKKKNLKYTIKSTKKSNVRA